MMLMSPQPRFRTVPVIALSIATMLVLTPIGPSQAAPTPSAATPTFSAPAGFDTSQPLRDLARSASRASAAAQPGRVDDVRPDRGATAANRPFAGDQAVQSSVAAPSLAGPLTSFEGLSNQDNFNVLGFRVNPPDPVGDVGPNHYVEMINLVFAVYNKTGTRLLGPAALGSLWTGFPITKCSLNAGDPVVLHDQLTDRWLLTQFTPNSAGAPFYNCVAISTTADPTGSYYRYAFTTGPNFPDYPKYGVWRDSYVITTREFGPTVEYGIGVYALEKNKMVNGDPNARVVSFFLDGNDPDILPLVGDGLLPADIDGKQKPKNEAKIPIVGTQDNDWPFYGATFDALNIFDFDVKWNSTATASIELNTQIAVASFDSVFPCAPGSRDCLPQPGIIDPTRFLDILSYRQRPTFRLAYRNFKDYEALVTNQSVEASAGIAGARWYEIRRVGNTYSLYQQGTYAPNDGVPRWMGSI